MPSMSLCGLVLFCSGWACFSISAIVSESPIISPNRVKATVTDRKTRIERTGFRRSAAQTSGRKRIGPPAGRNACRRTASGQEAAARLSQSEHKPLKQLGAGQDEVKARYTLFIRRDGKTGFRPFSRASRVGLEFR